MNRVYYDDIELPCAEGDGCLSGGTFVFTGGEQRFLHNLADSGAHDKQGREVQYKEPKRCKPCRDRKKEFFKNRGQ